MTQEQWKNKRSRPFIGCTTGNNDFIWSAVERIGEIMINAITRQASFSIYFKSGLIQTYIYKDYILDPIEVTVKGFFFDKTVISQNVQQYFDRNCTKLQQLHKIRNGLVSSLYRFNRSLKN